MSCKPQAAGNKKKTTPFKSDICHPTFFYRAEFTMNHKKKSDICHPTFSCGLYFHKYLSIYNNRPFLAFPIKDRDARQGDEPHG